MRREDVEALLTLANLAGTRRRECAVPSDILAELCRRWLAVEDARIREVEEEMHGLVIRAYPLKKGQRVRIVPEQGEVDRG